ncbi:hypothetical protein [Butyricicoccus sp. AM27-36]|uniref:hypothetical protein n=1 Tax=Butyricicoccus sp. AM27-36 TaxID=2292293 RepID=UPI001314E0CF|nr:hypothetical protein [Butyricicoccus sp. AM27-36]
MDRIEIYWGADKDFEEATEKLEDVHFLVDVVNHINKTDLKIEGVGGQKDPPMEVENLLVHTDDYGGVREWALLGFSNNVLRNLKVNVKNLWLATVYKGNIIKNLIMDCQSYTKYRPNETTGGIFVSWRRKEELPTGA